MKITTKSLRRLIRRKILSEMRLGGDVSDTLRSALSDEDLHDIRVIQIEHPVHSMLDAGDSREEVISALRSAIENLDVKEEELTEIDDLEEQEGSALMGKEVGSDDRADMGGYTISTPY